ncbi:hypothetical protein PV325_007680 [Microctonus aethiopoides]|uniref:C2H2-type domain-containing protein n=1 Tax=Microctonus aethiopoides TaxID=144406 RepID=A0AA39FX05_9HYME|nr:hypothetical protein PV325_007680 [Microctonus aethiopoides]KAK0177223.1 hypothetical protein PV328_001299 [Microctonus aethiopoides]
MCHHCHEVHKSCLTQRYRSLGFRFRVVFKICFHSVHQSSCTFSIVRENVRYFGKKTRYSFVESWNSYEVFKFWIHKVPSHEDPYYCAVCDKRISSSTHPSKHPQTAEHRYNLDNKKSNNFKNNSSLSDVTSEKMIFRKSWMEYEPFRPWLREDPHDSQSSFCLMCDKSMSASLSHIYRHAETVSNQKAVERFTMETTDEDTENAKSSFEDRKKRADIKYAAFITKKKYSFSNSRRHP